MAEMKTTRDIIMDNPHPPIPSLLYTFSILMAFSILCYIFVLYHFLAKSSSRDALNNHVIILLLAIYGIQTLIATSLHLDHFRRGYYWPPNMGYCFLLYMVDYVTYEIGALLMAWASIERHFLIFHASLFDTPLRRRIVHYFPLAFCFLYPTIYYTYFILFYPCESYYDMENLVCVAACFLWTNSKMAVYELVMNGFVPVCIIAIFSIALLVRVLLHKQRMGRQMTWKKNRKMTIQLLAVSTTFLLFNVGYFVIALGQMVWDVNFGANVMIWFFSINVCAPQLVFPFLCLGTMPNLGRKFKALNPWRRFAVIEPLNDQPNNPTANRNAKTTRSIRT